MSLASASTIAQTLPALLVAGFLAPVFLGWKMAYPERYYFASQTTLAIFSEGILLWFIVRDQDVPQGLTVIIESSLFLSLLAIAVVVWVWGFSRRAERVANEALYEKSRKKKRRDRD
jgi:hypothetical protein